MPDERLFGETGARILRQNAGQQQAFGLVALPSLWVYQILFPAISPIMDVTVVWALFAGNAAHVLAYYRLMVGVEFLGAALALWMDKGSWKLLPWLFLQRFVYRQLMYYVILKSLFAAVRGGVKCWVVGSLGRWERLVNGMDGG